MNHSGHMARAHVTGSCIILSLGHVSSDMTGCVPGHLQLNMWPKIDLSFARGKW